LGQYHLLKARCHSNGQGWLEHMRWPWLVQKGQIDAKVNLPFDNY